ncbi:hypothetical protein [Thioclava sp. GXIMD4216]|uniref:Secreted protein n=1 Tax=Thioclava litoralis TaxID=3076557 RepID=A0ABZ1E4Z4_9RHOB|nr:hypothetical protein RPE78_06165 [Thioclava sp. FTW29]
MKPVAIILALICALAAPAHADCYADYKAKQDDPLRLHYGVAKLPDTACSRDAARAALAPRLKRGGWTLLNIVSVFGDDGLEKRKQSAGSYFLRY